MAHVTIRDVARHAGVAVATVSRVMNNTGPVKEATRQRVVASVDELGYRPHRAARGLARGRVATVAVLLPFVTHPSAFARVKGIVETCRGLGLPVSIYDVESPEHQGEHLAALASELRPEGLIVISLALTDEQLAMLDAAEIRPVLVDLDAERLSTITIDDVAGGELATRHLLQLGHRRIAFVGDAEPDRFGFSSSARRHRGYLNALAAAGVPRNKAYERLGPHGTDVARAHTLALLDLDEPPTAIFAASDTQAMGALEAARSRDIRVPAHLSVVGFDDLDSAAHADLTTVQQPLVDSGRHAARIVGDELADPNRPPERLVLPIELVVRGSTAPPHDSAI